MFETYEAYQYKTFPEYALYNGFSDYNDQLTDQSSEGWYKYIDSLKGFKKSMLSINREELEISDQLNYQLFEFILNQALGEAGLDISRYLEFNQQNGYHIYFLQIVEYQLFGTKIDIQNYFSRLNKFPSEVNNVIESLRAGIEKNIMIPCSVSEQVLNQLKGMAGMRLEDTTLFIVKDKHELLAVEEDELGQIVQGKILSSYKKLYAFFKNVYHPNCRENNGIINVEGGKAYYEFLVRKFTNSTLSPEEIFKTGEQEVARIMTEMKEVKSELGYQKEAMDEFYITLRTDPKFYFDTKEELLNGFREILGQMNSNLPDYFGTLPNAQCDLKEIETYRAAAAPAAYYYPVPDDGSRPGYFYVNTYDLSSRPKYTMTALTLHEAVPGHHLQIARATELENVPWFRNQMSLTAFVEGWGLYAEYLGYEFGMYEDPIQKLGALTFEMWRACRLVIDVGIHYENWSRDEALEYLMSNTPISELDANSEIDRYISWPGQALGYKIGELKIKAIRANAENKLGDQFDIKSFHDVVLENGSIPLALLEEKGNEWIAKVKR